MKQWTMPAAAAALVLALAFSASAQTTLNELLLNENGTIYDLYPNSSTAISAPGLSVLSGFGNSSQPAGGPPFYLSGLGTLQYTVTGVGLHFFDAMLDEEADYQNGSFHDSGAIVNTGSAPAYLSWEVGYPDTGGLIRANTKANSLGDANDVPLGNTDIAVGLGFDFTLLAGQTATIDITASATAPGGGFFIQQYNSLDDPYFTESLKISSDSPPVPDNGATWFTLLLGLAGLAAGMGFERRFFKGKR